MKHKRQYLAGTKFIPGIVVALLLLLASCAPAEYPESEEHIPQDANRIILVQEGLPPAAVYADVVNVLKNDGYEIVAEDKALDVKSMHDLVDGDESLTFTAVKQVRGDMALRIMGKAEKTPGGSRLIAGAEYASTIRTPLPSWQNARWTNKRAKEAFFTALEQLRHSSYDAVDFETLVGVEQDNVG